MPRKRSTSRPKERQRAGGGAAPRSTSPSRAACPDPQPEPTATLVFDGHRETGLSDPRDRIRLAHEMFVRSEDGQADPRARLRALQFSVKLDPFELRYRLALAAVERELGLVEAAIAEYRDALEFWAGSPHTHVLLGEALLDAGNIPAARESFASVTEESALSPRALCGDLECDLRQEKRDWEKILAALRGLPVVETPASMGHGTPSPGLQFGPDDSPWAAVDIGLFCEKCLKIVVECEDPGIVAQVMEVARSRLGPGGIHHPAFQILERIARFEPEACLKEGATPTGKSAWLDGMLMAYLLARKVPLGMGDAETRLARVQTWRKLIEGADDHWPGLQDGYLSVLDEWASQAYAQKSLEVAGALWSEAERIAPANPAVLHNLALVSTRQMDAAGYDWYWSQLTRVWTLHGEMMPRAEGYARALIQKHQAFVQGAEAKLQSIQTPQELLELGALWIKEAVPLLALQQLSFRNPCFRCGVTTEDYVTDEERQQLVEVGHSSIAGWLCLMEEWQAFGAHTDLVHWRQARLAEARRDATESAATRGRFYDEEGEAFERHRESMLNQYLLLLFRVMMPVAEKLDLEDEVARHRYALVARGLRSFPHRLLKPAVSKVVSELDETVDLETLVDNFAIGPWFNQVQHLLQDGDLQRASVLLEEMVEIAPDFAPAYFYLAQCQAAKGSYDQAFKVLEEARRHCRPNDEMMEQLDELAEQMDIARVNQRLEKVQKLLERDDAKTGIRECQEALKEYPEHPYVWFLLGQAYLANLDLEEAKQALRQAREASKGGSELEKAAEAHLQQIEQYAPQIILSKAAARMQADDWRTALDILAKGHSLKPRDPQLTFYEAVCWAKIGDVGQAEAIAQEALHQCRKADAQLQAEIENFIPQIPVLLIGEDLHKAQKAMQRKRWRAALKHLDAAVSTSPDAVLALFYKAVCHFRLEEWDEAEGVARKALRLRRATDQEVADQLQSMLHQIPLARVAKDMETVTRAIKRQRWQEALDHLDIVLSRAPEHPVAHFLKAVCLFRSTMAKLNARTTSPRQSLLDPVEAELDEAERWSAGNPELAPQIKVLRSNVSLVRKQLKEAGIYL